MPRRRFFGGSGGIYDPNLTPLIDVCLVLVVILLVATPMTLQSGITVSRAAVRGARIPLPYAARSLSVTSPRSRTQAPPTIGSVETRAVPM